MERLTYPKLRFFRFKNLDSRSVFRDLQLTQISLNFQTSCYKLKFRGLGEKTVLRFSIILISKGMTVKVRVYTLLSDNINSNKNETESEITYTLREMNFVVQLMSLYCLLSDNINSNKNETGS